jgi:hypothetical protein
LELFGPGGTSDVNVDGRCCEELPQLKRFEGQTPDFSPGHIYVSDALPTGATKRMQTGHGAGFSLR